MTSRIRLAHFGLLIGWIAIAGCGHSRTIGFQQEKEQDQLRQLNERAAEHRTEITFRNGHVVSAASLRIEADSLSWLDPKTRETKTAATSDLLQVSMTDHGRGAANGLVTGIMVGGIGLALAGLAGGDDPACSRNSWLCVRFDAEEKAQLGAIGGGAVGGLIGLIGGGIAGSTDTYTFADPSRTPHPAPSGVRAPHGHMSMQEWETFLQTAAQVTDSTNQKGGSD